MKRIIAALFVLFITVQASAQQYQHALINREDSQSASVNNTPLTSDEKTIYVEFDKTRILIPESLDPTLEGVIHSRIGPGLKINFHRQHLRLPMGWSTSICFGETCYSPSRDSLSDDSPYEMTDSTAAFTLHFTVPDGNWHDSAVDYVKFVAMSGNDADTVGVILVGYRGILGVEQGQATSQVQSKILSLYPSPLIDGNSIRVKVSSPKVQSFSYSISDELGRSVAFGTTHQQLIQGDNTCSIGELAGLSNGTYLLKFTFGDGSVDTRTFQIAH
ncbi:MAG TPA: hypothetical protein VFO76_01740 [Candidatus Kapabacteria bacterium]|nr:hypothetical protein [Candidatus Kapabacteria bacterium]